jgi:predicted metal-dependent enzyme (double-stranded beta helix superfamily)
MAAPHAVCPAIDRLLRRLDDVVKQKDVGRVTDQVKHELMQASRDIEASLPELFRTPSPDCYARRLVHSNDELGYTVVAMTWGPGQGTPLHDHAGTWCVECVVQGELDVTQYDVVERDGPRFRFSRQTSIRATVGDAGCLIPPFEYHVLNNARRDAVAVTLHVYGGKMDHCHAYVPEDNGWWAQARRSLTYH